MIFKNSFLVTSEKSTLYYKTDNFDMKDNELTRQGFLDLNLMEASDRAGDVSDLWVTLLSMGYNRAMELTEV